MDFTCIADLRCTLGESPVWDERRKLLFFCDIVGRTIHAVDLAKGPVREWRFESEVCSLGLCESGKLLVALAKDVITFNPETGARTTIATPGPEPETSRLNDGKVGPDGCFWVGSMDDRKEKEAIGGLYRIAADGTCTLEASGYLISNGLAWSPDGEVLYHSDTRGPWIERYDFNPVTGAFRNRTILATLDNESGRPDGGACDAEGFYWSAGVSAGLLNRFAPDGTLDARYRLPVAAPTMPCFCGPDLRTLVVTSLRQISPEKLERAPLSGSLIMARSDVAGAPVARMKGL